MIDFGPEFKEAFASYEKNAVTIKFHLVEKMAAAIVDAALDIAPNAEDFKTAVHEDGPDGHALIVAEDLFVPIFEKHPELVNIMRSSAEWDMQVRTTPQSAAAYALATEAFGYGRAEALWEERRPAAAPSL
ncbi:hypothetical protein [Rhizobium sp. MHM7A]|uniref:hypothetical protein n=1 Tax=Rhizobium sp. MHM7A TaxID=2583233 RepID=UPI00110608ED|nr:hypothetical protein [Rhizobium sp. MHM7A]TLX16398.1 hypothetical protein FFR93_03435 [Rhizobium sp. MHM7A]